ncbi:unnamed protein product [Adineta steineri]|uniref:Uncharacterized protein n=1 Tax=Adineta steineri TaxID=433720 RepID=A0A814DE97_9BILA|nr:unnamed protein product [Adineta steineri]
MRLLLFCFVITIILSAINATDDIRQRFEGLVGKTVQAAWQKIDREAPGKPIEIMRLRSPQSKKPITPGYVRVILNDRTGRVLYTPILQPN